MHLMSKARIIGFAIIVSLAVQSVRAEDWKPEWTGPHPGWLTYKTNSLEIYYAPDSVLTKDGAIQKWAGKRADAYNDIVKSLQVTDKRTIKFFVYDNNEVAQQLIHQKAGFAQSTVAIIHTRVNQTVGHELTHVLSRAINGRPPPNRVLDEGLGVWMDHNPVDHLAEGRRLLEANELPTASKMIEMLSTGDESCYSAAGAYVGYLLTKYGGEKFKQIWGAGKSSYDEQFSRIYGKSQSDMDTEWRTFLKSYASTTAAKASDPAATCDLLDPAQLVYQKLTVNRVLSGESLTNGTYRYQPNDKASRMVLDLQPTDCSKAAELRFEFQCDASYGAVDTILRDHDNLVSDVIKVEKHITENKDGYQVVRIPMNAFKTRDWDMKSVKLLFIGGQKPKGSGGPSFSLRTIEVGFLK